MAGDQRFRFHWIPPASRATAITRGIAPADHESITTASAEDDSTGQPPVSEFQRSLSQWGRIEVRPERAAALAPLSISGEDSADEPRKPSEEDSADEPRKPSEKEELLMFLQVAAEVEHALLVQYLYALASFDDVSANAQAADLVKTVSLQEMAHWITVQNLLLAVGGPKAFHVGRDFVRAKSNINPLPLTFAPISHLTLSEYVLVEAPAVPPAADKATVEKIRNEVVMATGRDPRRVGAIYARIYWLLQPTDQPSGPISLQPDPSIGLEPGRHVPSLIDPATIKNYLATLGDWAPSGPQMLVLPTTTRDQALDAVAQIMGQGEGMGASTDSHFEKLLAVLKLFDNKSLKILPLPINPYVASGPADPGPRTQITHPYIFRWGLLFNVRYTMLIAAVAHAVATPQTDANHSTLVTEVFPPIMDFVKRLIRQMRSNTLTALGTSGPTFELLSEDFLPEASDRWRRLKDLLAREKQIIAEIQKHTTELQADVAGKVLLSDISQNNSDLDDFVTTNLPGS